jgi:hypothetical protein
MTLKELQDELKQDMKLDSSDLSSESLRTPDLHNKYNRSLFQEKLALKKLKREWDVLFKDRWEYYSKKADSEVYEKKPLLKKILPNDLKIYIAADSEMQNLKARIELKEELVEFLERAMDAIMQRNWIIRNSMEFLKFTNGIN